MGAILAAPACAGSLACCFEVLLVHYAVQLVQIQRVLRLLELCMRCYCLLEQLSLASCSLLECRKHSLMTTGLSRLSRSCRGPMQSSYWFSSCLPSLRWNAAFFFFFMVFMFGVKSSKDARSYIQNGFWFFKYLLVLGMVIGFFYIRTENLAQPLMYIGLLGGFLFILIQLILIVDFAHGFAESWVTTYEQNNSRSCFVGLIAFTIACYLLSIVGVVLMFHVYTSGASCMLPKFVISFNIVLCIAVTVISMLPKVQEQMPTSGLLQSSFLTLYTIYLTWSALMNNPDKECNPSLMSILEPSKGGKEFGTPVATQTFVSLVIWFMCLLYASLRSSSNTSLGKITGGSANANSEDIPLSEATVSNGDVESNDRKAYDNETEGWHTPIASSTLCLV
uniref:Serine incorporator n=1 Tax=Ditylenchus dipsaci TaxID=166011 RepID=A0A915CKK5_9BILA